MRYSQAFLKTTKETPKEAELISHQYLLRGGFIAPVSAGFFTLLPFGFRIAEKIKNIIREELRAIGVNDIRMPVVQPARLWKESGRFDAGIDVLWKIKSSSDEDFVLAMTSEEVVTDAAKRIISSYKDLPKIAGQIQTKIRDEARARGGLIRLREFEMQDAYSFTRDEEQLEEIYQKFISAYRKIFDRIGIETVLIESDTGAMGGSSAHEFMMLANNGEDWVIERTHVETGNKEYINAEKIHATKDMSESEVQKLAAKQWISSEGGSVLDKTMRGIEVANVFKLGTKYSVPQKLMYLDEDNKQKPVIMGCYGIGIDRLIGAIVEASHDDWGMIWPKAVAPYQVHLVQLGESAEIVETATKLYEELWESGIEVFYDDRTQVTAGAKFADADLLGMPYRITVSEKTLAEKSAEIKDRKSGETKLVPLKDVVKSFGA